MTLLQKTTDFVDETLMFDLVSKFYNQRDTIHFLFDPESSDVVKFLVALTIFFHQDKSLTEKKAFL